MDPALVATVAATGLYFREGNTLEDLINTNLYPPGCNLRQRSIVRDLLSLWSPFVKIDSLHYALSTSGRGLKGRLTRLKHAIFQGMNMAAQVRLRRKVVEEGWSRGVSYRWLELTSSLKKKWCNGIARFALLRWAVYQDDDVWLSRRTRHQQKCSHCSSRGETFPSGHTKTPLRENCIQMQHITPIQHCPFGRMLFDACRSYFYPDRSPADPPAHTMAHL